MEHARSAELGLQHRSSTGSVRVLDRDDVPAAIRVLSTDPVQNVFVASRVRAAGLEQASLGCPVWGFERDGVLRALCHAGSNLVPVNAGAEAIDAWTEFAGPNRMCASIIGPADVAMTLWRQLSERWGPAWSQVREVRAHQPLMTIATDPAIEPDLARTPGHPGALGRLHRGGGQDVHRGDRRLPATPATRRATGSTYASSSPPGGRSGSSTATGCCSRPTSARSPASVCQVQGVWLDPELRGRGLAAPAMAAVVRLARTVVPDGLALRQRLQRRRPGHLLPGGFHAGGRVRDHPLLRTAQDGPGDVRVLR